MKRGRGRPQKIVPILPENIIEIIEISSDSEETDPPRKVFKQEPIEEPSLPGAILPELVLPQERRLQPGIKTNESTKGPETIEPPPHLHDFRLFLAETKESRQLSKELFDELMVEAVFGVEKAKEPETIPSGSTSLKKDQDKPETLSIDTHSLNSNLNATVEDESPKSPLLPLQLPLCPKPFNQNSIGPNFVHNRLPNPIAPTSPKSLPTNVGANFRFPPSLPHVPMIPYPPPMFIPPPFIPHAFSVNPNLKNLNLQENLKKKKRTPLNASSLSSTNQTSLLSNLTNEDLKSKTTLPRQRAFFGYSPSRNQIQKRPSHAEQIAIIKNATAASVNGNKFQPTTLNFNTPENNLDGSESTHGVREEEISFGMQAPEAGFTREPEGGEYGDLGPVIEGKRHRTAPTPAFTALVCEEEDEEENKLARSKSPVMEALVYCALQGWGIRLIKNEGNDVTFKVDDFELFCQKSSGICSKRRPTTDRISRIKTLKRWFPDFPNRRGIVRPEQFEISIAKDKEKLTKIKKMIEKTRRLIQAPKLTSLA